MSYEDMISFDPIYDDEMTGFEGDDDGRRREVWYVLCEDEVFAETDSKEEARQIVKNNIERDLEWYNCAKRYKIEQGEF